MKRFEGCYLSRLPSLSRPHPLPSSSEANPLGCGALSQGLSSGRISSGTYVGQILYSFTCLPLIVWPLRYSLPKPRGRGEAVQGASPVPVGSTVQGRAGATHDLPPAVVDTWTAEAAQRSRRSVVDAFPLRSYCWDPLSLTSVRRLAVQGGCSKARGTSFI